MKTAIFLGAGASAAEGAPLQNDLFRDYFQMIRDEPVQDDMDRELVTYFQLVFGIDCDNDDLTKVNFPTFEEALGVVDLAINRNESLKAFSNINRAKNSYRLGFIRQYLVFLLARLIAKKLEDSSGIHKRLVHNLRQARLLQHTWFISTNYDIVIDNALVDQFPQFSLDYGIDFTNFENQNDWLQPGSPSVLLLKLHGSLNWLFCPTCNAITLTPKEKGVIRLFTKLDEAFCKQCETIFQPIIVPPTFYKDMSNVYLQTIWNRAEKALRQVDQIVFCGYSFPDADMHIKYLLKRAQTNRRAPFRVLVVNSHPGKSQADKKAEHLRFRRFLGQVEYLNISFEEFADDPSHILR